jgi:predicted nucleic acid-binding protein
MPDRYMIDSSVIAAIFFQEKASKRAVQAVQDHELLTLELAQAEVGNVAWKRIIIFHEDKKVIKQALLKSMEFIQNACDVIKTETIIRDAFDLAVNEKFSLYDSLFIAAAEKEKIPLLTLDQKLKDNKWVELI